MGYTAECYNINIVNKAKELRRLNRLKRAPEGHQSRNIAKRYKLHQGALEIIEQAGKLHAQQSRAIQIAVEIMWRFPGEVKVPASILETPLTAKTYKLPQRTVGVIQALAREYSCTFGHVLALCAAVLEPDVKAAERWGDIPPRKAALTLYNQQRGG